MIGYYKLGISAYKYNNDCHDAVGLLSGAAKAGNAKALVDLKFLRDTKKCDNISDSLIHNIESKKESIVILKSDGSTFVIPALVDGLIPVDFIVDSEASDVAIPAGVFRKLFEMGFVSENDIIDNAKYTIADGSSTEQISFHLHGITVGPQYIDDIVASVIRDRGALGLAQGRHFSAFRMFPFLSEDEQREWRDQICRGLSKLESLPDAAFRAQDVAPIRIVPRTPTETSFWVGKPLDRFRLEAERFSTKTGLETLHRHLVLSYRSAKGRVERLGISLPLFALLRDLNEGAQLIDAFSDDVFANLNVFTQRLAQEDERSVLAWTPANDAAIYSVSISDSNDGQIISLKAVE